MISWVIYVAVGLVVGGAAGFFIGRLDDLSKKERQAIQEKLASSEQELTNYKHEVTEHFIETAGLINNMTESYQAVHEHLAKGALSLCDHQVAVKRLKVTTAEALEKTDDSAIDSVTVKSAEHATEHTAGQSTQVQTPQVKVEPKQHVAKNNLQGSDTMDEYEQEQSSIKIQRAEVAQESKQEGSGETELSEEQQQETEEQKALADKQAAAMASRMVH